MPCTNSKQWWKEVLITSRPIRWLSESCADVKNGEESFCDSESKGIHTALVVIRIVGIPITWPIVSIWQKDIVDALQCFWKGLDQLQIQAWLNRGTRRPWSYTRNQGPVFRCWNHLSSDILIAGGKDMEKREQKRSGDEGIIGLKARGRTDCP